MSKKAALPLKVGRLQRVIAEEITDPAERAAIERLKGKSTGQKRTS